MWSDAATAEIPAGETTIFLRRLGSGSPVLLLHGFPQTHLMWRHVAVAGHDRGGRVAYRLALDHPDRVVRLAARDVVPAEAVWARADARFALGFWPWSLLAHPAPLPERLLAAGADAVVDDALGG